MNSDNQTKFAVVIDDDPEMCSLLSDLLNGMGFEVTTYGQADEALRSLTAASTQTPIDLIFCDLHMPGELDGNGFIREIRKSFDVPVILITAFGGAAARVSAIRSGASDVLMKPFSLSDMNAAIARVIA